jgi:hypothetical protein
MVRSIEFRIAQQGRGAHQSTVAKIYFALITWQLKAYKKCGLHYFGEIRNSRIWLERQQNKDS